MIDSHASYWKLPEVAQSISSQIISQISFLEKVSALLKKVPGMSRIGIKLHSDRDIVDTIYFKDNSGRVEYVKNFAGVYHVYVYNTLSVSVFSGFVDWGSTDDLLDEIEYIKWEFGRSQNLKLKRKSGQ